MSPSRIRIVPDSMVCPGRGTIFPPTSACAPSGSGRNPGGSNSPAIAEEQREIKINTGTHAREKNVLKGFMTDAVCGEGGAKASRGLERRSPDRHVDP